MLMIIFSLKCAAQNVDSSVIHRNNNIHFKQLYTPSVFIIAGMLSEISFGKSLDAELYKERNEDIPHFKTRADNYLQFSPIILAYGFDYDFF